MTRACRALVAMCAFGCAGPRPVASGLRAVFEARVVAGAARAAPDLFARAQAARAAAEEHDRAGRRAAAEDEATRARLLVDATVTEAERLALEAEALRLEAEAHAADERAGRDVAERVALERELARALAAALAREEAERALTVAAASRRARGRATEPELQAAAEVLVARAEAVLEAAAAMGVDPARVEGVSSRARAVRARTELRARVLDAEEVHDAALALLAEARLARGAPTAEEVATLLRDCAEAGLPAEVDPAGLRIELTAASGRAGGPGPELLARVRAIAAAHPHGPLWVESFGARLRGAERAVFAGLAADGRLRARVARRAYAGPAGVEVLRLWLPAYAVPLR